MEIQLCWDSSRRKSDVVGAEDLSHFRMDASDEFWRMTRLLEQTLDRQSKQGTREGDVLEGAPP